MTFILKAKVKKECIPLVDAYLKNKTWDLESPYLEAWNRYIQEKGYYEMFPKEVYSQSLTSEGELHFEGEWSPYFPMATMTALIWDYICIEITEMRLF